MKRLVLLAATFLSCTCTTSPTWNRPVRSLRQCWFPVVVKIDAGLPIDKIRAIERGLVYWNLVTGKQVFTLVIVPWAELSPQEDHLPIRQEHSDVAWCGLTRYNIIMDTCVYRNEVIFSTAPGCFNDNKVLETVARHEAGHVLGLDHSTSKWALMYYAVNREAKHPVAATDEEKATARALVKEFKL